MKTHDALSQHECRAAEGRFSVVGVLVRTVSVAVLATGLSDCMGYIRDRGATDTETNTGAGTGTDLGSGTNTVPVSNAEAFTCNRNSRPTSTARIVRLTERQYNNTVRDLLGTAARNAPPASNGEVGIDGVENPFAGNFTASDQIVAFSTMTAAASGMPEALVQRVVDAADQVAT